MVPLTWMEVQSGTSTLFRPCKDAEKSLTLTLISTLILFQSMSERSWINGTTQTQQFQTFWDSEIFRITGAVLGMCKSSERHTLTWTSDTTWCHPNTFPAALTSSTWTMRPWHGLSRSLEDQMVRQSSTAPNLENPSNSWIKNLRSWQRSSRAETNPWSLCSD